MIGSDAILYRVEKLGAKSIISNKKLKAMSEDVGWSNTQGSGSLYIEPGPYRRGTMTLKRWLR